MDNQEAFVQELKEANQNILRLTLALEGYTEKTDEKLIDYKERLIVLDKESEECSDKIKDLEFKDSVRSKRESIYEKILYGTVASVIAIVFNAIWELIKSHPNK